MKVRDVLQMLQGDGGIGCYARQSPPFKHPSKPRSRDHGGKAKRRLRTRYIEQYPQAVWSEEVRPKIRYAIVIEKADSNYSAYVPDLPGCVATGATVEEVESRIREATEFHLEGMRKDGVPVPAPVSKVEDVEIAA